MADNPFTEGSLPHVFVQKGEHIGLPDVYSEMKEVMPSVNRLPDGRIYLQTMHSTDPLATGGPSADGSVSDGPGGDFFGAPAGFIDTSAVTWTL